MKSNATAANAISGRCFRGSTYASAWIMPGTQVKELPGDANEVLLDTQKRRTKRAELRNKQQAKQIRNPTLY
jgi:hypothetical protein